MKKIIGFAQAKLLLDRYDKGSSFHESMYNETPVEDIVINIINDIKHKGDKALIEYTEKLDNVHLDTLEVAPSEISNAYDGLNKNLLSDLIFAAKRIAEFHLACKKNIRTKLVYDHIERQIRPLNKIGIYVPGGTAAYPSTVFMTAIPAKVAGVDEIIMVTPPQKDGTIPGITLAAAKIAGVNKIYKIGGAQAIAALAYGTDSIPRVDKICGPGNIFVATAKRLVYGSVDIDGIQGPSEVIVIADNSANPSYCAADLIAQAEHDAMATAIFITTSMEIATKVEKEIKIQLSQLSRKSIIESALDAGGAIVFVDNLEEAIELANLFSPEHLLLMIENGKSYSKKVTNAGCVFIGETSPVVLGDYIAGPSHVLPTGGTARFTSPLGVESFLKVTNFVSMNKNDQNKLGPIVSNIARAEGLDGHANAIDIRLNSRN